MVACTSTTRRLTTAFAHACELFGLSPVVTDPGAVRNSEILARERPLTPTISVVTPDFAGKGITN